MNKLAKTTRKWYKFTCSFVPGIVSSHYIDLRSSSQGDILIALGFPGTNLEKHWRTALTRRDEANWNLESNLVCVASDTVSMPREHISSSLSLQDPRRIYMCILLSLYRATRVYSSLDKEGCTLNQRGRRTIRAGNSCDTLLARSPTPTRKSEASQACP